MPNKVTFWKYRFSLVEAKGPIISIELLFLPRPFPVRNGRGQHAVIKVDSVMTNGPIRAKYVNQSSAVIGQYA